MAAHLRFVRDHHKRVRKIAVVTDSKLGSVAEHLASHFVAAQIKQGYPADQASGFRLGELRGAFTLRRTLAEATP